MDMNTIPDESEYNIAMEMLEKCSLNAKERAACRKIAGKHLCNEPVNDEETISTYRTISFDYIVRPVLDEFDRVFSVKQRHLRLVVPPPRS